MKRLPLTVISGYLGAGKTTLINRMLAAPHGLRLLVMVNDFGAINIDATLIEAQSDDLIALTNGCVCCTMGADLFMAIGDVLDRPEWPDHLIIEASGIADPSAIANVAITEPDLRYAGIITLVDAHNIRGLLGDPLVSPQVLRQIRVADLVALTKQDSGCDALDRLFAAQGLAAPRPLDVDALTVLTLSPEMPTPIPKDQAHASYTAWSVREDRTLPLDQLREALRERPPGLYRMKGFLKTDAGLVALQVVGQQVELTPCTEDRAQAIVALGPEHMLSASEMASWWQKVAALASTVVPSA